MAIMSAYSGGGLPPHGSGSHIPSGVTAGTYNAFSSYTVNTEGALTFATNGWDASIPYAANQVVIASNSKPYRAVISNTGNDPTTDNGTNWVRVSIVPGGTSGQIPVWSGTAATGDYVATTIGAGVGTVTSVAMTVPTWLSVAGSPITTSGTLAVTAAGGQTANSFLAAPSGSAGAASMRAIVALDLGTGTANSSKYLRGDLTWQDLAGAAIANGATTNSMLRWSGAAWVEGTGMLTDGTYTSIGTTVNTSNMLTVAAASGKVGASITGVASQNALVVAGATGAATVPPVTITNDTGTMVWMTNSLTPGAQSGSAINFMLSSAPTASGNRLGALNFSRNNSGTVETGAAMGVFAAEDWSGGSARGSYMNFFTVTAGGTTNTERMRITATGTINMRMAGSAVSTSGTDGFLGIPNCAGTPTGTPSATSTVTGCTNIIFDTTHNTLLGYNSGWFPVDIRVPVTLTDAANIATDASLGKHFRVTLGGNRTMDNPTNPINGQKIIYEIIQDGTGSRTITWGSAFAWGTTVTVPTLTTTAAKRDFVGFVYNSTTSKWYGLSVALGY